MQNESIHVLNCFWIWPIRLDDNRKYRNDMWCMCVKRSNPQKYSSIQIHFNLGDTHTRAHEKSRKITLNAQLCVAWILSSTRTNCMVVGSVFFLCALFRRILRCFCSSFFIVSSLKIPSFSHTLHNITVFFFSFGYYFFFFMFCCCCNVGVGNFHTTYGIIS